MLKFCWVSWLKAVSFWCCSPLHVFLGFLDKFFLVLGLLRGSSLILNLACKNIFSLPGIHVFSRLVFTAFFWFRRSKVLLVVVCVALFTAAVVEGGLSLGHGEGLLCRHWPCRHRRHELARVLVGSHFILVRDAYRVVVLGVAIAAMPWPYFLSVHHFRWNPVTVGLALKQTF